MSTRVITIRATAKPSTVADAAAQGAEAILQGKLVGFATETVYGIAALATDAEAMRRLRTLKRRPAGPFSLHLPDTETVRRYVQPVPPRARWLMAKAWPGPVTVLLNTGERKFPDAKLRKVRGLYDQLTADGVIGLRCPDEPVARTMLRLVEGPVVAPSANLPGAASPRNADDVLHALRGHIDLLIDSGPSRFGKDSSIVRIDGYRWKLLRKGVYDERMLNRCLRRKIGFVCTGNTCRSPMAAGLAKVHLAEAMGCAINELRSFGVEVFSAGIFAGTGGRPTPEAVRAIKARGADIARNKSRKLTTDLIKSSDMLFCMTARHLAEARRLSEGAPTKIYLLDERREVLDPIGGDDDVYDRTAEHIDRAVRRRIAECVL